jgi:hypothetical protein
VIFGVEGSKLVRPYDRSRAGGDYVRLKLKSLTAITCNSEHGTLLLMNTIHIGNRTKQTSLIIRQIGTYVEAQQMYEITTAFAKEGFSGLVDLLYDIK